MEKFAKDKSSKKDGHHHRCKLCQVTYLREWKQNNPDKVRAQRKRHKQLHSDQLKLAKRVHYYANREVILANSKKKRTGKRGYLKTMLRSAKARAKEFNLQFDIDLEYLEFIATDHCPVDGLPFDWDRQLETDKSLSLATPSLDRIDSSQGYVKGNVKIIGWKWNAKKSNMNLDDLLLLVEYVRSATKLKKVDDF